MKIKFTRKIIVILWSFTVLLAIGIGAFLGYLVRLRHVDPVGRIAFTRVKFSTSYLYVMDGNGNNQQALALYDGPTAWSRDGKWLAAAGCEHDKLGLGVCLIDTTQLPGGNRFPPRIIHWNERRLELPTPCKNAIEDSHTIRSISWSGDGKNIAVKCGSDMDKTREVCILPVDGRDANCWLNSARRYIARIDWSPIEDRLLIQDNQSRYPAIYLVDQNGNRRIYLTDGWNPVWAPDGKRFAYIKIDEESTQENAASGGGIFGGVAVMDKDGENQKWLLRASDMLRTPDDFVALAVNESHITWSPNSRYIAFAAGFHGEYIVRLFRLDTHTREVIFLTNEIGDREPSWGP